MNNYEVEVEESYYEVELGGAGISQASLAKAGRASFQAGNDTVSVNFVTAIDSVNNFALLLTMQNTLSSFPQDLTVRISSFTVNGFTCKVNAPPDDGNYSVNWMLVPITNG